MVNYDIAVDVVPSIGPCGIETHNIGAAYPAELRLQSDLVELKLQKAGTASEVAGNLQSDLVELKRVCDRLHEIRTHHLQSDLVELKLIVSRSPFAFWRRPSIGPCGIET